MKNTFWFIVQLGCLVITVFILMPLEKIKRAFRGNNWGEL